MYIYAKVRNNIRKPSGESLRRTAAVRSIFMSNKSMSRLQVVAHIVPKLKMRDFLYDCCYYFRNLSYAPCTESEQTDYPRDEQDESRAP